MPWTFWAAWGVLGAFCYATPSFVLSLDAAKTAGRSVSYRLAEWISAMMIGPIFGAGLGPFAARFLKLQDATEITAFAFVVGMVANPVAPWVVKLASGAAIKRLSNLSDEAKRP